MTKAHGPLIYNVFKFYLPNIIIISIGIDYHSISGSMQRKYLCSFSSCADLKMHTDNMEDVQIAKDHR